MEKELYQKARLIGYDENKRIRKGHRCDERSWLCEKPYFGDVRIEYWGKE